MARVIHRVPNTNQSRSERREHIAAITDKAAHSWFQPDKFRSGLPAKHGLVESKQSIGDDGWTTVSRRRAVSPTPWNASTISAQPSHSAISSRSSRSTQRRLSTMACAASTAQSAHMLPVGMLSVGAQISGVVTGVHAYGAFIDVGVCKDGFLHVSEAGVGGSRFTDLSKHLKVGDTLCVQVRSIEDTHARFTLTRRGEERGGAEGGQGWRGKSSLDSLSKDLRLEQSRKDAQRRGVVKPESRAAEAELHTWHGRERAALAAIEASMTLAAEERFAAAEARRLATNLPTVAEMLCGTPLPPPPPPPLEVVLTKLIHGQLRHLYKMPWKQQIASEYGGVLSIRCAV